MQVVVQLMDTYIALVLHSISAHVPGMAYQGMHSALTQTVLVQVRDCTIDAPSRVPVWHRV